MPPSWYISLVTAKITADHEFHDLTTEPDFKRKTKLSVSSFLVEETSDRNSFPASADRRHPEAAQQRHGGADQ